MSELFTEPVMTAFVAGTILAGIPLLLAALGETISQRCGVLNIGLEGMMIIAAYCGFLGVYYGGSTWLGYLAGVVGGLMVAGVMAILCVRLGLDQIVIGIALTVSGLGITTLLHSAQFGTMYPRLGASPTVEIPGLSGLPVVGESLFDQSLLVYLGFALAAAIAWLLRSSRIGLNLRATGERPEAVDAAGVSVVATRAWATLATGALAGLGGAYLAVTAAGIFVPFMTNGAGFIAIVIAMLGRGRPLWVVVASLLFGGSVALSTSLQVAGIRLSSDVVNMLPFLVVMVTVVLFGRRAYLPAALTIPYVRGAR